MPVNPGRITPTPQEEAPSHLSDPPLGKPHRPPTQKQLLLPQFRASYFLSWYFGLVNTNKS